MTPTVAESLQRSAPAGRTDREPADATPAPGEAASLTVRLKARIDPDALGEHLVRLWRSQCGRRRIGPVVELSIVETCGRNPTERERDAMRLLRSEAREHRRSAGAVPLRATLVSVDVADHLLLLAVPAEASALLGRLVAHLSQSYPLDATSTA